MRPRFPEWSCSTTAGLYPERNLLKPCTDIAQVHAVKIGPLEIGDSQGSINNRWWLCYQDGNGVYLRGAVDLVYWDVAVLVFNEPDSILRLDFTFDQLGREIVFYQVGTELRLWYFDSLAGAFIKRVIETDASQPFCGFDLINDTSDPMSDAALYYVKNDQILERLQRDRYDIVYDTGAAGEGVLITSCGMREDNKFQVEYVYDGAIKDWWVLETDLPIMFQLQDNELEIGFRIERAPNKCQIKAQRNLDPNYYATVFSHSGYTTGPSNPDIDNMELLNVKFELINRFDEFGTLIQADATNLVIEAAAAFYDPIAGNELTYFRGFVDFEFTRGDYIFKFLTAPEVMGFKRKNIEIYKDGVLVFSENCPDIESRDNTPLTGRNRLRFGAMARNLFCSVAEQNTLDPLVTQTTYSGTFAALFSNVYTVVNGANRTDWVGGATSKEIVSVPPGNNMTRRTPNNPTYLFPFSGGQ